MRFGILAGSSWLARLSLSCKCLPCWVPVKHRGLSTGHSCFPFLLNHTAAIWTRLSPCNATEHLRRPRLSISRQAWPSEPRPLPSVPVADLLVPSSPLFLRGPASRSLQVLDTALVDMLVCVRVCVCLQGGSSHSYTSICVRVFAVVYF